MAANSWSLLNGCSLARARPERQETTNGMFITGRRHCEEEQRSRLTSQAHRRLNGIVNIYKDGKVGDPEMKQRNRKNSQNDKEDTLVPIQTYICE